MSSPVNAIPASPKKSYPTRPCLVLPCWRSSSTISPGRRRGRRHDRNTTRVRLRSFLYTMDRHPAALGGTVIPLPAKGGTHNGLYYCSCSHCSRRLVARWHLQPARPQTHHEGRSLVGHGRPAEASL